MIAVKPASSGEPGAGAAGLWGPHSLSGAETVANVAAVALVAVVAACGAALLRQVGAHRAGVRRARTLLLVSGGGRHGGRVHGGTGRVHGGTDHVGWNQVGRDRGAGGLSGGNRGGGGVGPGVLRRTVTGRWGGELGRAGQLPGAEWWSLAGGLVVAVLGASVIPVLAGAVGVPLFRKAQRSRMARRETERRGDEVIALCGALAGEVRAGRQPGEALLTALRDTGGLGTAQPAILAAARFGGDVPAALAGAARQPGAEGLRGLAACWRVAVDQGAGLAAGLDRLELALRAERDQRADLRAQLAGSRSTAVMLAALPVLGILLGTAIGADPLRVLLHTGAGLVCLVAGSVLEATGLWWALRIVRGAEAV